MNENKRIKQLLDHYFRNDSFLTDKGRQVIIDYSHSGDIDEFIHQGHKLFNLREDVEHRASMTLEQRVDYEKLCYDPVLSFEVAVFFGGKQSLDAFVYRLTTFTEWVMEDREFRGMNRLDYNRDLKKETFEKRFSYILLTLIGGKGDFLPDDVWQQVFLWLYGDTYDPSRQFPITFGEEQWCPELFSAGSLGIRDNFLFRVLSGSAKYLFRDDGDEYDYFKRGKPLVNYLPSVLPHLNKACYVLKRYKRRNFDEHGNPVSYSSWQAIMRGFIAKMNGVRPSWELEELEDENEPVFKRDPEMFEWLKIEMNKLDLPEEYYQLEEFVLKHGENYLDASE